MSLDQFNARIESLRAEATGTRTRYNTQREDVAADPTLTPEGKRLQTNEAAEAANAKLADLHQQEVKLIQSEYERLERAVFGTPPTDSSGIIAFRDAQERAIRLEYSEDGHTAAAAYLRQAKLSGDQQLASAVLARAMDLGWSDLVGEYRDAYPTTARALDDLVALKRFASNSQAKMHRSMFYSPFTKY